MSDENGLRVVAADFRQLKRAEGALGRVTIVVVCSRYSNVGRAACPLGVSARTTSAAASAPACTTAAAPRAVAITARRFFRSPAGKKGEG